MFQLKGKDVPSSLGRWLPASSLLSSCSSALGTSLPGHPARTSDSLWPGLTSNLTSQIYSADFYSCSSHSGSPRITGLTHSHPHPSHTTCTSQPSPNELQNSRKCSRIRPPSHPHCSDRGPCQSLLTWLTQCLNFILCHQLPPTLGHLPQPTTNVFHQSQFREHGIFTERSQAELGEV